MKRGGATAEVPAKIEAENVQDKMADKVPESGASAALDRLSKTKTKETAPTYKARDYEAEAIGKTRCVQFEAALMSPALAGMRFDTMAQYLALVKQAADAGVAYSFQK